MIYDYRSWPRSQLFLTADIHDDDIGPDLFNIFIGNADVWFTAEQIKEFVAAGDKDFADLSAALIKFQIGNSSQFFTIPHIDYIFAFQFRKEHIRNLSFSLYILFYVRIEKGFKNDEYFPANL